MEISRKRRGANFSSNEITFLMRCLLPEIGTIENKKTDGTTLKEKHNAWKRITHTFNSLMGLSNNDFHRDINSIKLKYENIKRTLKRKITANKQNYQKTGGGPSADIKLLWYEEQLYSFLQLGIDGLDPQGDSDMPEERVDENLNITNVTDDHCDSFIIEVSPGKIFFK